MATSSAQRTVHLNMHKSEFFLHALRQIPWKICLDVEAKWRGLATKDFTYSPGLARASRLWSLSFSGTYNVESAERFSAYSWLSARYGMHRPTTWFDMAGSIPTSCCCRCWSNCSNRTMFAFIHMHAVRITTNDNSVQPLLSLHTPSQDFNARYKCTYVETLYKASVLYESLQIVFASILSLHTPSEDADPRYLCPCVDPFHKTSMHGY